MAVYGDPTHDGRVQREAVSLAAAGLDVTLLALEGQDMRAMPELSGVGLETWRPTASRVLPGTKSPFHPGDPGTLPPVRGGHIGWFVGYGANLRAWGRWAMRTANRPDVWHAHDFTAILALWLARLPDRVPLIYDSHELYLESGSAARMPGPIRWALGRIERQMARRASGVITINQGVADELAHRYEVDPTVVLNCPPFIEVHRPGRMRAALGLGGAQVILYHGSVSEGRGIELTVEALRELPDSVVYVVLGNGPLVPWLRVQQERPELEGRIVLHPAVPLNDLLSWVVDADLGLALHATTEMNFLLSTPNKLFECIAAGVPVLASGFPEMGRIVEGEEIGATCDPNDPHEIAAAIRGLLEDQTRLAAMQQRARDAARSTYNWEAQAAKVVALYRRALPAMFAPSAVD
jgi:glycosyltransferase involved in cell wall biosynthesis